MSNIQKHGSNVQKFYRMREVCELLGISKATVYNWMAKDAFPKQVKVGGGTMAAWREVDIAAWQAQQQQVAH